jgi:hypothetical protein
VQLLQHVLGTPLPELLATALKLCMLGFHQPL